MHDPELKQDITLRKIMSDKSKVSKRINGALLSAIHDHGPITTENYSSATKRIITAMKVLIKEIRKTQN